MARLLQLPLERQGQYINMPVYHIVLNALQLNITKFNLKTWDLEKSF
jgi:hypothetical protein